MSPGQIGKNLPSNSDDNNALHSSKHPRRQRYPGKYPKKFSQKYKELNSQDYPDIHEHLRAKGKTPAGTHIPIMVEEVIAALRPRSGEIVADCTIGYGGHALEFIKRISPAGRLIGLDVDGQQLERTRGRLVNIETPVSLHHRNFAGLAAILAKENLTGCDIIFADLGVSSMQIDDPGRGISYKHDSPLDMRLDNRLKQTAADLLMTLSEEKISQALWELADEPDHQRIANWIVSQRQSQPITKTTQLVRLILNAKGLSLKTWRKQQKAAGFGALHPAARTFQALRILVNDELGSLRGLLRIAPACLRPGGRIGIISFHSGEDRLVKQAFRDGLRSGTYASAAKDPLVPRTKEIISNPRSASAKFRWAQKPE
jgi:16S rRNA (cytosine1402-N4)-methyltransferase